MSKYKKRQSVWVKGIVTEVADGVEVKFTDAYGINDAGDCYVMVSTRNVKPSVVFPWSPAKAKKKARKQ